MDTDPSEQMPAGIAKMSDAAFEAHLLLRRCENLRENLERSGLRIDQIQKLHNQYLADQPEHSLSLVSDRPNLVSLSNPHAIDPRSGGTSEHRRSLRISWKLWWLTIAAKSWIWHFKAKRDLKHETDYPNAA